MKNYKKYFELLMLFFSIALTGCVTTSGFDASSTGYVPPKGFVPDASVAVRIAEAIWIPIYGEAKIKSEKPFKAVLENGIWKVRGTFHNRFNKGGVAEAEIAKDDGRIVAVSHGK